MAKRSLRQRLAVEPGDWGFSLASRDPGNTLAMVDVKAMKAPLKAQKRT